MKNRRHYFSGVILALIGCASLGILGVVDKIGAVKSPNPLAFSSQSLLISLAITITFAFIYLKGDFSKGIQKLSLSVLGLIILVGVFASGLTILFRFLGLIESTGTFATLSQVITTSLTALLAWIFLKERLSLAFWILFIIIITATYFVSVGKVALASIKTGDLFIVFGTIFLATGNILSGRVVQQVNPILASVGRFLFGFISLSSIGFIVIGRELFLFSNDWVFLSGFLWAVSVIAFNLALKRIGVTFTTALLMLAPIITMILEYLFRNYQFTSVQIIAAMVIVAGGIAIIFAHSAPKLK